MGFRRTALMSATVVVPTRSAGGDPIGPLRLEAGGGLTIPVMAINPWATSSTWCSASRATRAPARVALNCS